MTAELDALRADLRLTTTTARGAALVSAVSAALDACAAYESSDDHDELAELYARTQSAESDVLRLVIDMEAEVARLKSERQEARKARNLAHEALHGAIERAQQAESTRDAAQAVATRETERARKAEAERDEWKGVAIYAASEIHEADRLGVEIPGGLGMVLGAWADTVADLAAGPAVDPAAGTGDHEREPGRMGE